VHHVLPGVAHSILNDRHITLMHTSAYVAHGLSSLHLGNATRLFGSFCASRPSSVHELHDHSGFGTDRKTISLPHLRMPHRSARHIGSWSARKGTIVHVSFTTLSKAVRTLLCLMTIPYRWQLIGVLSIHVLSEIVLSVKDFAAKRASPGSTFAALHRGIARTVQIFVPVEGAPDWELEFRMLLQHRSHHLHTGRQEFA